ncbi:helix-turn-helix transcriptional regulator [Enterococcus casseliflavus]|uniref:helix-turn-helix transcriptional regulator n=1 Tax=Enterococcus casseliflavus TaxID=37734 RepID=UPI003D09953E
MHESLSKKLKEYRSRHNLTQKELAARLFVSDKAISKWERGNGLPDIETLVRLADLLGTPVEELLKEKKETYYYEYKSERTVLRLPLMHILIPNLFLLLNQVTSVRAFFVLMKELPTASGWFSLGVKAKGIIALGVVSLGFLSIGLLSFGMLGIGTVSTGVIAIGNLCFGFLVGIGNLAVGSIVVGNLGIGWLALANVAIAWIGVANYGVGSFMAVLPANSTTEDFNQAIQQLLVSEIPDLIKTTIFEPMIRFTSSPIFVTILATIFFILCLLTIGLVRLRQSMLYEEL